MKSFPTLCLLLLATFTSASGFATIPLTRHRGSGAYLKGVAEADRARASHLKSRALGGASTVPATNFKYELYTIRVGIGNPPTYYQLVVDTGSSNTFCGVGKPYNRTSTSIPTNHIVDVRYGTSIFLGKEYLDQVTLAPNLVIVNQSIGDVTLDSGLPVNGIIGFGPLSLTRGRLLPDTNATIPTVMNNLAAQGLIEHQILGVSFAPLAHEVYFEDGALTYGGVDSSLYEGELTYAPVTETYPSSYYWGINVTSVTYGNHTIIPYSTAGIVDTGTTFISLADDFFDVYANAIGATLNSNLKLIEIPVSSVKDMRPLEFTIADRVFTLDVAAQLIPQFQNAAFGGEAGKQYGVVTNMGQHSGKGLDFILGMKFMERFYAVFDADNDRVGFAETKNTFTARQDNVG